MSLARLKITADLINEKHNDYSLLDAGCRTMVLKPMLNGCREYYGGDIMPAEGVLECNLEQPLKFEDNQFDVVTALDVLEHLDHPHEAFHELCRVAKKTVIISLPNMYYISFRWNFLRGRGISGKYAFPLHPILDRHRWVLSYSEALAFIEENSKEHEANFKEILPVRGRTKLISEPIEKWLAKMWPNLFVYGALAEITISNKD